MSDTKTQTLALQVKSGVEPIDSWQSLCRDPNTFLTEVASRIIAVGTFSTDTIVISDKTPAQTERRKIWIKTSFPYGIGFLIEGSYQMDYGMSQYPVNVPFLKKASDMDPLPAYTREIPSSEITAFGLPKLGDKATENTSRLYRYYIFEPSEITL